MLAHDLQTQVSETDVVVVGAGLAGLCLLWHLRSTGLRVRCIEEGDDVGGTWYWNRYPGARCDVESIDYSFGFSPELEQEWTWTEKYASQAEILRYLQHVADRFDLRRVITFGARVNRARFDEDGARWTVETSSGEQLRTRFLVLASGPLSAVNLPDIDGLEDFAGEWYHTARWPHQPVDFSGRRVGVIGTGSSGIQSIPEIAKQAKELVVFQRTPNFSVPARHAALTPEYVQEIKDTYRERRRVSRTTSSGNPFVRTTEAVFDVDADERERRFQKAWTQGGAATMMYTFGNLVLDRAANDVLADFVRRKIAETVTDPETARKLMPTSHAIGTKRICVDDGYYETFNLEHVTLVDVRAEPIERMVEHGIKTADAEYALDDIVFATGFDAMSGAALRVELTGRGGRTLGEAWADGPRTYLGLTVAGFPNLFLVHGPQSPSTLANMATGTEQQAEWIVRCVQELDAAGITTLEATSEAQEHWTEHTGEVAARTLYPTADSWYTGANIEGKPRGFLVYIAGFANYSARCDNALTNGFDGFAVERSADVAEASGAAREPSS